MLLLTVLFYFVQLAPSPTAFLKKVSWKRSNNDVPLNDADCCCSWRRRRGGDVEDKPVSTARHIGSGLIR